MSPRDMPRELLGGRYRILRLLGQGGMGEVYHARDTELDRDVALKVVRRDQERNPDLESRLRREAHALGRVVHPNVVKIYDVHTTEAGWLYAMSYVEGQALSDALLHEHFELERSVEIVARLADGLAAAHEAGVIHRDVKPENVLLSREGHPLLVDFGLARFDQSELTALTRTGEFVGTLQALPPEVYRGAKAGPEGDVFQLGLVLYELMTGKHLYADVPTGELIGGKAHAKATGKLSALARDGEGPIEILLQSLHGEAAERPDAASFRDVLNRWRVDRGLPSVTIPSLARRAMERKARESRRQRPIVLTEPTVAPSSSRLRVRSLILVFSILIAAAMTWFLRPRVPGPLPRPEVRIQSKYGEARCVWTTESPRRFSWNLLKGPAVLLRGEETERNCVHEIRLTRLTADRSYTFRLFEGSQRWDQEFRTSALELEQGCWTFAERGMLFATFTTPLAERSRFVVEANEGTPIERRPRQSAASIVIKQLPLKTDAYRWKIDVDGQTVASGRTPAKAHVTSLPGRRLTDDGKGWQAVENDVRPLWIDDELYVGTDGGCLVAYGLARVSRREDRSHAPLELRFATAPPGQGELGPLRRRRPLRWLCPLKDGRLLVGYRRRDDTPALMVVDTALRARRWSEGTDTVDGAIPAWALDSESPWNRPLPPREKQLSFAVEGIPSRRAVIHQGRLHAALIQDRSGERRVEFLRLDWKKGQSSSLGHWLPEGEARPVEEDEIDVDLVPAERLLLTVTRGPRHGKRGIVSVSFQDLVGIPLDPANSEGPRRLLRFESVAWRPRLMADPDGRHAWVSDRSGMIRVDGRTGECRHFPFHGGGGCDLACGAAVGPLLIDSKLHFVVAVPNREGLASTLPGIDEAWIYLARFDGTCLRLCRSPLATEVHKQRITQWVDLSPWHGGLVALTGQTLLIADPIHGRSSASSRFHTEFATCRPDGITALAGPYDQLHLVAAPALAAQATAEIDWLPVR